MKVEISLSQAKSKLPQRHILLLILIAFIKQHQTHHEYLDICTDVKSMLRNAYQMMFNDQGDILPGAYTDHEINILDQCQFYIFCPVTKKPHIVTFYVVSNEGNVPLSCTTPLALILIYCRPCFPKKS